MAGDWLQAGLPWRPNRAGLSESREDYVLRFEPEVGPVRRRRASTARRTRVQAVYRMTGAQRAAFLGFAEAQEGATFTMPDPFWRPDSGDADEVTAEIDGSYQISAVSADLYDVGVQLVLHR